MCFSATANFVGSGVLGALGVVTLAKVKHRRELLFAALPALFAVHQFIEGFVWLGLDGTLSPTVTRNMGAAFMVYAQGLLVFLCRLAFGSSSLLGRTASVCCRSSFLAERRDSMCCGRWPRTRPKSSSGQTVLCTTSSDQQSSRSHTLRDCDVRRDAVLEGESHCRFRSRKPGDPPGGIGSQGVCVYIAVVRVCGDCKLDHPRVFLGKHRKPTTSICGDFVNGSS